MDSNPGEARTPVRRGGLGLKLGLVAASMAVGAIGATAIAAGAASTSPATPSPSASASASASTAPDEGSGEGRFRGGRGGHGHGSAPARSDEKAVTDAQAAALKAAALKAVPGGTVYRVETDAGDAAFEAHMTKADGTEGTVKFDEKLAVIEVQEGRGKGDPPPPGE